jgi:hypothetical protein
MQAVHTADSVELLGHKSARRVGDKIHICTNCNFPISVYGRLVRASYHPYVGVQCNELLTCNAC